MNDKVRGKVEALLSSEEALEIYAAGAEFKVVGNVLKSEAEHLVGSSGKRTVQEGLKTTSTGWNLSENGSMINGRFYTKHALERMAPSIPEVVAELERRALGLGHVRGSKNFLDYVQARNIPPMLVEDVIKNGVRSLGEGKKIGTMNCVTEYMKVIINNSGDVISVYKIG
jgi:hypothetical protein